MILASKLQKLKLIDQVFTAFLYQNHSLQATNDAATHVALQISVLYRICDLILTKQMRKKSLLTRIDLFLCQCPYFVGVGDDQAYLICKCLQHSRMEVEIIGISFYSNYLKMNVKRASEIIYGK